MPIIRNGENKIFRTSDQRLQSGRVNDVILDINHPLASKFGGYDAIGTVFYTLLQDTDPIGNNSGVLPDLFFRL